MILSLCVNPCIDRTASCPVFDPSSANRISLEREDIGGKGINTAIALRNLGGEAEAVILVPEDSRSPLLSFLARSRIPVHEVPVAGRLRVNLKIRTRDGKTIEINEQGALTGPEEQNRVREVLLSAASPSGMVLLTGSLPPGMNADYYARLVSDLKRKGIPCAVDADGEALRLALREKPALIKPNLQEFTRLTGQTPSSPSEAGRMADDLRMQSGCGAVCLSLGGEGAVLASPFGRFYAPAVPVTVRSLHGAGDSMLAALCLKAGSVGFTAEALRFASAAAAATVRLSGTQMCTLEDTLRLAELAQCHPLPV